MNRVVIDASVATKWFFAEPDHEAARRFLEPRYALIAPDLVVAEVCNVAWKKVRSNDVPAREARIAAQRLPDFFDELIPIEELSPRAVEIALELNHPVYDTFYLALAEMRSLPLVTADRRLVTRVAGTPFAAFVQPLA